MTSSKKSTSPDSLNQKDLSVTADDTHNQDTVFDSAVDNDVIEDAQRENTQRKQAAEIDIETEAEYAQSSDAEITIETISDDVVVATLASPKSEAQSTTEESEFVESKPIETEKKSDFFQTNVANTTEKSAQDDSDAEVTVEAEDDHPADGQNTTTPPSNQQIANQSKSKNKNVHRHPINHT